MHRGSLIGAVVPALLGLTTAALLLGGQRGAALALGLCIPPISLLLRCGLCQP